jgi:hypothetical protein
MGTIQEPNPDREWLKRSYVDTATNPYSIDARTEMMGRLVEGNGGGGPVTRRVMRTVGVVALAWIAALIVLSVLMSRT